MVGKKKAEVTMANQNNDIQSKYQMLDHRDHVLLRPNTYIGSIDKDTYNTWTFDSVNKRMVKKDIEIVPGLYKIFDEILVNAIDHVTRLKMARESDETVNLVKNIKVTIEKETGTITVWNDGDGIEVEMHPEHKMYVPEMIFGFLLTSTNYDDSKEKIIGGQNGLGAKCTNIFSKRFYLETVDHKRKRFYSQEWTNNMSEKTEPVVKYCAKKPYTQITFVPDYARFNLPMTDDVYNLFMKRVYDVCALTDNDINVWLNGEKLEFKNFERYVDMYLGSKTDCVRVYESINERWEVIAASTANIGFEQVSFVNGIWTIKGGKHVDYISNQITQQLADMVNKKRKDAGIKPQHIKNYLMVFVKSTISNPTFDSQTKEFLSTPVSKFGSKADISEKFIEKLYKSDIVDKALNLCEANTQKTIKKTDGKKSSKIRGLVKLDDANFAGTAKSKDCTLILTEGDSAKSTALAGLAEVGRDYYGVFPLRGKLLNVKDLATKKVYENEEIQNIKKILGLESGKLYNDLSDLRYGRIMIMSDQDHDGSHIRGLIMNLFHTLWPSLFKMNGFITSLLTPIIKATNNSTKEVISFYNVSDFETWMENKQGKVNGWKIKYYKGLGTSNEDEAKTYFKNMRLIQYKCNEECDEMLDLAFNKKRADDRKKWMGSYNPKEVNEYKEEEALTYKDFINRELIHFSVYDVKRSIPSMVDGLKPSQRKILYCCFKRNLVTETKVAQLSGYVSEHASYHHGEASLQGAIICMAQDFVGANNVNLLKPNGQFGSRVMGGKDASAPRYIYTELMPITFDMFKKEDTPLLNTLEDDGTKIEPEYYVPVIPMALINGCIGIGTGFSTNVPAYNPIDVINCIRQIVKAGGDVDTNDQVFQLKPWYRGFTGEIVSTDDRNTTFVSKGKYTVLSDKSIEITELPVGLWTEDYKAFLEEYLEKNPKVLKDYESHYNTRAVKFVLHFQPGELEKVDVEKEFKLVSKPITTSNMHLFDRNGVIKKYNNIAEIMMDFYDVRKEFYQKRKDMVIESLQKDINKIDARIKFITEVCDKTIPILGIKTKDLNDMLALHEYPLIDDSYTYLTGMPIQSLTHERIELLKTEAAEMYDKMNGYKNKTIGDLWCEELDVVEAQFKKNLDEFLAIDASGSGAGTKAGKAPAKKRAAAVKKTN